jgi:hypothetical protein
MLLNPMSALRDDGMEHCFHVLTSVVVMLSLVLVIPILVMVRPLSTVTRP